jgi:cytochrome c2
VRAIAALVVALAMVGCRELESSARTLPAASANQPARLGAIGDATRGAALVREFECSRCHEGSGAPAPATDKACAGCHRRIVEGQFSAAPEALSRYREHLHHFLELPSLAAASQKLRRSWLERFLLEPNDVRPSLDETMPRLPLTREQARDIAAHLAPDDTAPSVPHGSLARGRELLEQKGCAACHRMSGVPALAARPIPVPVAPDRFSRAFRAAPDLTLSRARLVAGFLERWLTKPSAVDPNALMPDIPLSEEERRDLAAYILGAPLQRELQTLPKPFTRLPVLGRPVLFAEVKARVFRKTCWHCHSEPDYAIGDGGPGNTGGFGFAARGINLAEHETVLAGFLDENGKRKSLFAPERGHDGRLVRALLARHEEEQGRSVSGVRGMPLGLPALDAETIQLVESWIAQGRPM